VGKYLDLARKSFAGTTDTTETTKAVSRGTLVVFGRFGRTHSVLEQRCPDHVPAMRWQQAIEDGRRFLATWGTQAGAMGWSSADLFGLAPVPAKPHPSYRRLSRYDASGLCWLLQGRQVIALTEATATIRNPATGSLTTYRRFNKPSYGPLGDSLEDF
jgi:hypothetical protein